MKLILISFTFFLSCAVFADASNIYKIYNEEYSNKEQGLYIEGNTVFIIVLIKNKLKNKLYQPTGMLRSKALIDNYITKHQKVISYPELVNSSYISELIKGNNNYSYQFNNMKILENRQTKTGYRYVIVIQKNELDKLINKFNSEQYTVKNVLDILKNKKQNLYDNLTSDKIRKLLLEIGCLETLLAYENDELGYEYNLQTYTSVKDYIKFLERINKAYSIISKQGLTDSISIQKVLSFCPGNYDALLGLKNMFNMKSLFSSGLLINMIIKVYDNSPKIDFKKITELTTNKGVLQEYKTLLAMREKLPISGELSIPLQYVIKTFGHVNFANSNGKKRTNKHLQIALDMFRKGNPSTLPAIIKNLNLAANDIPENSEIWALLGTSKLENKKYLEAVIYLSQALFMSPQNTSIKVNLANTYSKLGFISLAKGMAVDALTDNKKLVKNEKYICEQIINL